MLPLKVHVPDVLYHHCSSDNDKRFARELKRAREVILPKILETYGPNSPEYKNAKRALDSYGDPGKDNGVSISFGTVSTDTGDRDGGARRVTDENGKAGVVGQSIPRGIRMTTNLLEQSLTKALMRPIALLLRHN